MESIRTLQVDQGSIAIWYLGQNGFILKDEAGFLVGIDLYLSDSCASDRSRPFRLDRQLPIFIEPEDLDIDVFVTTHAHQDHADPVTLSRMPKTNTLFVGPFDSIRIYRHCGIPESNMRLIHPGERLKLAESVEMQATFALPTDTEDLNHTGVLLQYSNGIRFLNTGDTAYAERMSALLPADVDVCAICINGGFHNLGPAEAAAIVEQIRPKIVIPCHYDMMVNNVGSPEMFRMALELSGSTARFELLSYYEPWIYRRNSR